MLDVGAGTGILSLFCARAGAKRVFAVEASEVAGVLQEVVSVNGFSNIVTVIEGRIEEVDLPDTDSVDIIISEWMGFFLLHESMLESLIFARNKWLKGDGVLFPDRAELFLSLGNGQQLWEKKVGWSSVFYGFDLSPLLPELARAMMMQPLIESIDPEECNVCAPKQIVDLDLYSVRTVDIRNIDVTVELKALKDGIVQCFVVWFEVSFPCDFPRVKTPGSSICTDRRVVLSTSPESPQTHWKQSLLMFERPIPIFDGLELECKVKMKQTITSSRQYAISVEVLNAQVSKDTL